MSPPVSTVRAVWPTVGGVVRALSLTRIQSVVATLAGVTSVVGASFSLMQFAQPANTGELVAMVSAAGSNISIADATVEVLTIENALVATLTPDSSGRVTQELREGIYVVRVSHPRYVADVRRIQVQPQRTIEIKATLRTGSSSRTASAPRTDSSSRTDPSTMDRVVDKGVDAALKKFGF